MSRVTLRNYTLTYDTDQRIQGWPSFYSYTPDYMIGMNSYFYTFSGGELYRHNINPERNNFYGVRFDSTLTTVFNTEVLNNKLYKTLELQGAEAWGAQLTSDIQTSFDMPLTYFERKEQVWFAFVRNQDTTTNFSLRSVNGIADSTSISTGTPSAVVITFDASVDLSGINAAAVAAGNVADSLFFGTGTPTFCGQITNVTIDPQAGIKRITVDTTVPGGNIPGGSTLYYMSVKNAIAESHGVLGHYAVAKFTHPGGTQAELFAVRSDVMRSYP